MKTITITKPYPILFPDVCSRIVKVFAKKKIAIDDSQAQHIWHLLAIDKGLGWMVHADRTDADIFKETKKYYVID